MFGVLRLLIVWRLVRLLGALALCGLLVAVLASARPNLRSRGLGTPHSLRALTRELQGAFGPEIRRARRAVTGALLSGRPR